jgi:glycosyltransferase involved in cell wall biosynthesis
MTIVNPPVMNSPVGVGAMPRDSTALGSDLTVALLTGGIDRPYAFGMSMALVSKGVALDVIGSTQIASPEMYAAPKLKFLNLYGDEQQTVTLGERLWRHLASYWRIVCYAGSAKPKIFHILWNGKLQLFDRTVLMLYYKVLGKKIVLTAHNVNVAKRDGHDSSINRWSLKMQYHLVDHIFVHTDKMKEELVSGYKVKKERISVIAFGINNSVPDTELTPVQAKQKLQVSNSARTILFYGRIRPYKGIEYLVAALRRILHKDDSYRLIIAGEFLKESRQYWGQIQETIERERIGERVIQEIRFIPDEETEIYFKAADVLVLPYTGVFQSGVLFLAYSFGLPVIATDIGSFRDDIVEGETGYICRSGDEVDLARTIETYFESNLFKNLDRSRAAIRDFAQARNSWSAVGNETCNVYAQLMAQHR